MKQIAQEQKYIVLIAPVGRGRNKRLSAGCDEGKAFPLLIVLIYLYLEKLAKQQWITRMYVSAASETGYTGIRADEEARKSLTKTRERMVRNISRESFDAGEYVRDLIGSSIIGKLNSHLDTIAGRTDGVHLAAEVQKKNSMSGAENLLNAMKVLEETSAMMKKTACKKAAQDAGILLDQKIEEAYSGIDTTNKNVEESIDSMLYGAGYLKSGNLYARKILSHSYLVEDVYKIQAIAGYNWYRTAKPELRISSAMFDGLETDGIITLMNTATMELEDWQVKIFGVHDGVRDIKGEIEKHIGSKQDYGSEIGRIMFQYDRNEKEKDAGKAEFEAAPWDKQIAEAPCSWVEVPSLRSVVTTATAVASAVVTTVATSALSVVSFGTLSAPMAALCAAGIGAAITLSAEATFAAADIAGGYRDWDEVGKDLAISAATSVISAVGGAAGAAIKGIGGIGGALLKTGVNMSTSATNTVASKAIQYAGDWDGFASSMSSFDTWSGVITSGAGSLVTNCLNLATIGDNGVKVTGFSSLTELKAGSGSENAQTVRENGKRVVYLNGYSNDMTREEQLKLGITLGHESYRDGIKSDEITQKIETHEAVAGHTDLMAGMLADDMYKSMMSGIIAGDTNLQKDLLARSLGDEIFNDYVDGMYDSSADYWRVVTDKNGNITNVQDDGDYEHFNVYDEKGKKKGRFADDGTSLTKQIASLGNGTQSRDDINYLMWHDFGLDYKDGKGWYAVDERGIYTNDSIAAKLKNSQVGKAFIGVTNAVLGTAYDFVYTDEKVEKKLNNQIEERYSTMQGKPYADDISQEKYDSNGVITSDTPAINCIGLVTYLNDIKASYDCEHFELYDMFSKLPEGTSLSDLKNNDVIWWKYTSNKTNETEFHVVNWRTDGNIWESAGGIGVRERNYNDYYNNWLNIYNKDVVTGYYRNNYVQQYKEKNRWRIN